MTITPEQTAFLLLGALIATAIVLVAIVIFVGTIANKALRYGGRFKGIQLGRKGNGEMSFGGVIDETPGAYKDIDAVMAAQADLVEVAHTLKQVVCVKG